jgi:MFS family permease
VDKLARSAQAGAIAYSASGPLKLVSSRPDALGVVARYRVLFCVPGFSRLLVSSVLGRMPSGMFSLAILLFVREQTGSFLSAGLTVGAFTLAGAIMSPVAGALVDRLGQSRLLVPCAFAQGALLVALVLAVRAGLPVVSIVAVATLAGALLPPISGCIRALWSVVAPDAGALELAYALDAVTQEVIYTLGPLLVGAVAVVVSPAASVLLCAAITVAGTLLFAASALSREAKGSAVARSRGGALVSSGLRTLLVSAVLAGMVIGALEVGLPALAVHLGSRGYAGVFLALFSIGSMAGGLLYSACSWRVSVGSRYPSILLAVEISVMPLLAVHSLAAGLFCSVIAGLGVAPMLACQFSLVGTLAPAGSTTEAFTWHRAATVGGIAAGSALGGALVDAASTSVSFALACTVAALACVLAALGRQRIEPLAMAA